MNTQSITRPGRCIYIWKIVGGSPLAKGARFRNRADSKAESLAMLQTPWLDALGGTAVLIKTI